jgi:hypothetical protein
MLNSNVSEDVQKEFDNLIEEGEMEEAFAFLDSIAEKDTLEPEDSEAACEGEKCNDCGEVKHGDCIDKGQYVFDRKTKKMVFVCHHCKEIETPF